MIFNRSLRKRSKTLVGVDIGSSSIKVALIESDSERPGLLTVDQLQLPSGAIENGTIHCESLVVEALMELLPPERVGSSQAATALPVRSVLLKQLACPPIPEREMDDSLVWQVSECFAADISEINFDYKVLKTAENDHPTEVLLAATYKDNVAGFTKVLRLAGLHPVVLDIDVLTLYNLFLHNYEQENSSAEAILDIGASTTELVILRGTSLLYTSFFPFAVQEFEEQLLIRSPDVKSAGPLSEIQKALSRFQNTHNGHSITSIYLCGGGSLVPDLPLQFSKTFNLPVHFLDPLKKLNSQSLSLQIGEVENRTVSALAIGLALRMTRET